MNLDWAKAGRIVFGGAGPKENERRYIANAELRCLTETAEPWTVDGLRRAVADWLESQEATDAE